MRILVADGAPAVRSALRLFIEQWRAGTEVIEVASVAELDHTVEGLTIDLALVDWALPHDGGEEALALLHRRQPGAHVVVLSGRPEDEKAAAAAKADAFVSKGDPPDTLRSALERLSPCPDEDCARDGQPTNHTVPHRTTSTLRRNCGTPLGHASAHRAGLHVW